MSCALQAHLNSDFLAVFTVLQKLAPEWINMYNYKTSSSLEVVARLLIPALVRQRQV